jgi:tetratricopeptide (TPR) repeat protein
VATLLVSSLAREAAAMPDTPPHTVFVSHAHADNELCDRYVAALRERGLDVWYDRTNLQVGHSLSTDIEAELRRRTAFVVIATPASLASQWVRSEIAAFRSLAAHDPARLFLPVRAAECEMPLLWADILWIDAVTLGFEAAFDALAAALGAPVAAQPTPAPPRSWTSRLIEIVEALNTEGDAFNLQGSYESALGAFERARALTAHEPLATSKKSSGFPLTVQIVRTLVGRATALRGLGRIAEAEDADEKAKWLTERFRD